MKTNATATLRSDLSRLVRQRLLDAALHEFGTRGYVGTTVGQIVRGAGTTRTTFYRYFRGKAAIALQLGGNIYAELGKQIDALDAVPTIDRPAMRRWVDSYLALIEARRPVLSAHWDAAFNDPEAAADTVKLTLRLVRRMQRTFAGYDERDRAAGEAHLALLLTGIYTAASVADQSGGPLSPDQRAAALTDMLIASLTAIRKAAVWSPGTS